MRAFVFFGLLTIASAGSLASQQADVEIRYLIGAVADSGCIFQRNGSEHDADSAADHLRLKYRNGARYADTAEHFIDRLASKSSWTGKKYTITCNGVTEPSGSWLHRRLQQYRSEQTP
jgi:hypothetical protein